MACMMYKASARGNRALEGGPRLGGELPPCLGVHGVGTPTLGIWDHDVGNCMWIAYTYCFNYLWFYGLDTLSKE